MLSGVSGGIGEYLNLDPTLVRLGFVVLTFITGGAALLGYVIAWVVIPEHDAPTAQAAQAPTPESDIASRIYNDEPKSPAA